MHFQLFFIFKKFKAYFGCFDPGSSWDLFVNSLTFDAINSSPYTYWQNSADQNYFVLIPSLTIAQCVNFCFLNGFALAGLTKG
jgi:hypothetical protein